MFRHQAAFFRELNNNKGSLVQHVLQALVALTFIIKTKVLKYYEYNSRLHKLTKSILL